MSIQIRMTDYAWNGTALLSPGDTPSLDGSVAADLVNGGKAMYISERESNKEMSDVKANVDPVTGGIRYLLNGPAISGEWVTTAAVFKVVITGTGLVTMDARDANGDITSSVYSESLSGAVNQVGFPYAGDAAMAVRFNFPSTISVQVI